VSPDVQQQRAKCRVEKVVFTDCPKGHLVDTGTEPRATLLTVLVGT
jgi:hypothetical protein